MPPFFPNDFVSPSTAIALVGAALYGDEWNGCPTLSDARSLHIAIAALRSKRTIARQRKLWPTLRAKSRIVRRRARILELSVEGAAKHFVSLGDADKKAIADEIEAKFAEDLVRERRCWQAKNRLLELFCSAQVTTTLLVSSGKTYEMACEFWASDQAMSAVDSGKASYDPAMYKSEPSGALQGRVLIPKADLMAALEGAPSGLTRGNQRKGAGVRRRGRKKGSGSLADKDKPLLELMKPLIAGGKAHWAAAMEVVGKAAGTGTDESKVKRLVARYREWEKTTQFN